VGRQPICAKRELCPSNGSHVADATDSHRQSSPRLPQASASPPWLGDHCTHESRPCGMPKRNPSRSHGVLVNQPARPVVPTDTLRRAWPRRERLRGVAVGGGQSAQDPYFPRRAGRDPGRGSYDGFLLGDGPATSTPGSQPRRPSPWLSPSLRLGARSTGPYEVGALISAPLIRLAVPNVSTRARRRPRDGLTGGQFPTGNPSDSA
jgi:hypothetical protein